MAHKSGSDETLFGGAAGGGKSEFVLGALVTFCLLVPGAQVVAFRRTFPYLKRSLILKLLPRIPKFIARYNSSDHAWVFANGSRYEMAYMKHENDIYNYQSAELAWIAFDELTQFTEAQYKYLSSRARPGGVVLKRTQQLGLKPSVIATANPGGIGHLWVKGRFIDPASVNTLFHSAATQDEPDPLTRHFLPSLMTDNPHLDQKQYRRQLQAMDPILRKAFLEGNWDILEGVCFTSWNRGTHVIVPDVLPAQSLVCRALLVLTTGPRHPSPHGGVRCSPMTSSSTTGSCTNRTSPRCSKPNSSGNPRCPTNADPNATFALPSTRPV